MQPLHWCVWRREKKKSSFSFRKQFGDVFWSPGRTSFYMISPNCWCWKCFLIKKRWMKSMVFSWEEHRGPGLWVWGHCWHEAQIFGSREAGELDWQLSKAPSIQEPSSRAGHPVSLSRTFCILKMGTHGSLQVTPSLEGGGEDQIEGCAASNPAAPGLQTEAWSAMEQGPHSSHSSEPKLRFIFGKGAGRTEALGLWCVIMSASCYH